MPDGNLPIINTKLLKISTLAEEIKENATGHRNGIETYEKAHQISGLADEIMKTDLHNLRKEFEE